MPYIALVDCNNFFAACERLFNPKLIGRPVVVLSNNDGCIIARSQEAKALGIPMGAAYHEWTEFLRVHDVAIFSSNFPLYGNMSHRVMQTLAHFNPSLEIYSIDEAFLDLSGVKDPLAFCQMVRKRVLQWTGIEVSIGIGTTKTLAKVANFKAKRDRSLKGVFFPRDDEMTSILKTLPVGEIWGIGRRLTSFLKNHGVHYAKDLIEKDDLWVKKSLTVTGLKTVWELRGIPCISLEEAAPPKQSILTSRSFGAAVQSKEVLAQAVSNFVAKGVESLREESSLAGWVMVFISTSFHKEEYYANEASVTLPIPTDYTPRLLEAAKRALDAIFRPGLDYKRAGVLLGNLTPSHVFQPDFFETRTDEEEEREEAVMRLVDQANAKYGYEILKFLAQGIQKPWKSKCTLRSACYTSKWEELLTIKI